MTSSNWCEHGILKRACDYIPLETIDSKNEDDIKDYRKGDLGIKRFSFQTFKLSNIK